MAQIKKALTSDNEPGSYPQNVAGYTLAPYFLDTIRQRLSSEASRLFTGEAGAALDFLDLGHGAQGMFNAIIPLSRSALHHRLDFWPIRINNAKSLRAHLEPPKLTAQAVVYAVSCE